MASDRETRIRFMGKVISACIRKNASLGRDESDPFLERLYSEYQSSGLTLDDCERWLDQRLANTFLSLAQPPVWIEEEPNWPYLDGEPMTFMCQITMGEGDVSTSKLSPGETVYLFGARHSVDGKVRMVYQTVSQFDDTW